MSLEETLAANLVTIKDRIAAASLRADRNPQEVTLVCVSKTVPAATIAAAHSAGGRVFGENYAQHLRDKARELETLPALDWHFIGPLQRNKVKYVVGTAGLIHTVHSPELVDAIDSRAEQTGTDMTVEILIQLNLSGETTKSGISPDGLEPLLDHIARSPHCRCAGLMTMPPFFDDPERARPLFVQLRKLRDSHRGAGRPNVDLQHLSMGMSGDFEVAVEEGATLVRVGTAIFGSRR